ncbi:Inactive receptor kinase precursor [Actinidia chinensis var. chinensis]|uniref:Inactive receptor kinase n=1 Tax=Actinidia chinensis var. chinensis TaxID=1590841 RepID=A0A2R6QHP9_ACTCC|nr:Inactive receptor kinase precursor [Actinidia chinensis var. chinensis]
MAVNSDAATSNWTNELIFFGNGGRVFGIVEMLNSYARVLRKGSFGTSYWADLEDGDGFVVKRFRVPCDFGREKVEKLGQMVHKNLLPIRAYGCGEFGKLLVCDYMAMGSLFDHLHGREETKRTDLSWQVRHHKAYGVARGINISTRRAPNPAMDT